MPKLFNHTKNSSFIIFIAVLVAIMFKRISFGIDLGDESYYASFLDGWLKDGLRNSANLMIHQTAELLIFPLAYAYQSFVGSETGLILFLRLLYTLLSFAAMLTLYCFIKPLKGRLIGALVLAFGVLFIPWGLPAPSYNTLGMYGMVIAISLFGIALQGQKPTSRAGFFSAFFWAFSIVAYPSLVIAFVGFILISFVFLKEPKLLLPYLFLCGFLFSFSLVLLFLILGSEQLIKIFQFSNAMLQVSGLASKVHTILQVFHHSIFSILCLVALLMSGFLAVYPRLIFLTFVLIYLTFFGQPSLFLASHDLIFIIALLGFFIPINALKARASPSDRIVALMYCSSFFAGLVTTITASNGLFNFPVGGLLAACLSLAFLPHLEKRVQVFVLVLSAGCMGFISCSNFYGEIYGQPRLIPTQKITKGVFAGLKTSEQQANFINKMIDLLPQDRKGEKIIVFGRLSALYLLTSLSPAALSTWNYQVSQSSAAAKMIRNFYQEKRNQPYLILDYRDPWGFPLAEIEKKMLRDYERIDSYQVDIQSLAIYQMK